MKKLLVFLLILACLGSTMYQKVDTNPLFLFKNVEKVCIISNESFDTDGVESVECGEKYFNYCSLETAKNNLKLFSENMSGMQFYINDTNVEGVFDVLKANKISESQFENVKICYGYTAYFSDSVLVDNKKVNLQIAVYDENMIVGFPLILTGY